MTARTVSYYKVATGEITGIATLTGETSLPDDEACLQGEFDPDLYYVRDAEPVLLPPRPGPWANFDHASEKWIDRRVIEDARAEAKLAFSARVESMLNAFTAGYPRQETLAWGAKMAAARRVLAGGAADAMLQVEADALGIPVATLSAKVVAKGAPYERLIAVTSARRKAVQDAIDAAATPADVDTVLAGAIAAITTALAGG